MTVAPGLRLLLVEDDEPLRRALGRTLATEFTTLLAASHDEALRFLDTSEAVDVVLSDYALGSGPGGDQVLLEAGRRFPGCVRVLMSGSYVVTSDAVDWVFVKKPIDIEDLLSLLQTRLHESGRTPSRPSESG